MKLTAITGAEVLPKKEEIRPPEIMLTPVQSGYNQAVDAINSVEMTGESTKLDDVLYELSHNEYGDAKSKYDLSLYTDRFELTNAIIKSMPSWVRLEKK